MKAMSKANNSVALINIPTIAVDFADFLIKYQQNYFIL